MNDFYVYLYLREDGTPYYVGKGKDDRAFGTHRGGKVKVPLDRNRVIFHTENLTEEEAFALEKELIAKYGRKDNNTGILLNMTDGGEGASGRVMPEEERVRRKEILNSPEVKEYHKKKLKEYYETQEGKNKISKLNEKMKIYLSNPENKRKWREKQKEGINNLETRKKLSMAKKENWDDPKIRQKYVDAAKRRFQNPEERNKLKEIFNKPEVKAKKSAATKEYYRKKREAEQASANTLTKFFSE